MKNTRVHTRLIVVVALSLMSSSITADAATCNVPSGPHPTIQAAVDDGGCTPIVVAAGTYPETVVIGRSLALNGAGSGQSFIQGGVEVQAGTVSIAGFHISGAGEALWAHSGAEVSGFDLEVINGAFEPPLFGDGFEDGTTDAWAAVVP